MVVFIIKCVSRHRLVVIIAKMYFIFYLYSVHYLWNDSSNNCDSWQFQQQQYFQISSCSYLLNNNESYDLKNSKNKMRKSRKFNLEMCVQLAEYFKTSV